LQQIKDLQILESFFNENKTKQLHFWNEFLNDEDFKKEKIVNFKEQINKFLETATENSEYVNESKENVILRSTLEAQNNLKTNYKELASEPDENSKNEILKSLEVKSEADLEEKIKSDPKYSQTNLNASQLISFSTPKTKSKAIRLCSPNSRKMPIL